MQTIRRIPSYAVVGLLLYMPFHILLSQWLSTATGGLSAWKAAKDVIGALALLVTLVLVYMERRSTRTFNIFFILASIYFALHLLIWLVNPHIYRSTAFLGIIYNNRLLGYLLLGMGATLITRERVGQPLLIKPVVGVSTVVCILGILQYFLPKDLMTHFGYSLSRGVKPSFFIDDKPDLPRIMATLRDPNSLGAYLILPITFLVYKLRTHKDKMLFGGLLLPHVVALFLTFSRSAWLGAVVSVGLLLTTVYRQHLVSTLRRFWIPAAIVATLFLGLLFTLRNQYVVQNVVLHSDESTTAQYDSNGFHLELIERGLKGIIHQPEGHGPGTAGLVSIQNPNGGLLTENYYVQIGYEVGIVGLLVFLAIQAYLYIKLQPQKDMLTICLLTSFWAYVLINMLLHIWSNEAVAAQWWLLAGVALAAGSNHHAGAKPSKK